MALFISVGSSPPQMLTTLINAYWLLCDTTNEANMFYGDQLITAFLTLIIQTTTILFYFFQRVTKCNILFSVNDGFWALMHFLHLVLLSHSSTDVTRSVSFTVVTQGKTRER
ncbi:hypothetical protein J6590_074427 [Homalodisca vitripennis]|nr:hypothetical protein J6590_074427 [Homalodisca vitripennis]